MSKQSFTNNIKASITTPMGGMHLILTLVIIVTAAFLSNEAFVAKVIIIGATLLAYLIGNTDFRNKRRQGKN